MKLGTQEVAELLGVKPHVLRYWEQEIPLIAPERDAGGRKVYRDQDIRLLHRIRHLVVDKKFTLQGALERILEEAGPEQAARKAAYEGLRAELLALRGRLTRISAHTDENQAADPRKESTPERESSLGEQPPQVRARPEPGTEAPKLGTEAPKLGTEAPKLGTEARRDGETGGDDDTPAAGRPWALLSLSGDRLTDAPLGPPAVRLERHGSAPGEYFHDAAAAMVRSGEVLVVTGSHLFLSSVDGTPAECLPVWPQSRRSLLSGAIQRSRALAYRLGRPPRWLHLVWEEQREAVEGFLAAHPPLFRPELLAVPGPASRDTLPSQLAQLAGSPYATFLGWLESERELSSLIYLSPLEEVSAPFLDEELLAHHLASGIAASSRACDRGGGRWRLTGGMIYSSDILRRGAIPLEARKGAADTIVRQVSLAHLFAAVGGVAVPTRERCLRPSRYDRGWPEELEALLGLLFRDWCERAGRPPQREIDPLVAENPEELALRRGIGGGRKGESKR